MYDMICLPLSLLLTSPAPPHDAFSCNPFTRSDLKTILHKNIILKISLRAPFISANSVQGRHGSYSNEP